MQNIFRIEILRLDTQLNFACDQYTGDITFINADPAITSYINTLPIPPGGSLGIQANNDERQLSRFDINLNGNTNFFIINKKFEK